MNESLPDATRRDFLTGRAARRQIELAGEEVADAIVEAGEHRPVPVGHDTVRLETAAMACQWAVVMNPGPPRQVMVASDALDLVHALEDQLTVYRADSELMRINLSAHDDWQPVESELFDLLQCCRSWSEQTGGAFDATTGAIIRLWRGCRQGGRIPSQEEITDAMQHTGIHRVLFDEAARAVRFTATGCEFDLGAVGKGFAVDQAAQLLQREGIGDFLVHGGQSSLFAAGDHNRQGGWPIGIRNPLFTEQRYATILLNDAGMSTSGSNIQYFRHAGKRYGHILDPRTGWPAHSPDTGGTPAACGSPSAGETDPVNSLLSVTVLAPTAAEADALSTAFYVMGLEKARDYCHNRPDVGAILIPTPTRGRTLEPVVCNLAADRLYFEMSGEQGA
jgi:thiamine biosynthesis lipoprotein